MALFRTGALPIAIERELINPDTVSCHPFRRLEAQFDTVVISLSPSVRFNLLIYRMHERFCLLKHVINPRSPGTAKLEVRFPTANNVLM
jgi:hypothetical protein